MPMNSIGDDMVAVALSVVQLDDNDTAVVCADQIPDCTGYDRHVKDDSSHL